MGKMRNRQKHTKMDWEPFRAHLTPLVTGMARRSLAQGSLARVPPLQPGLPAAPRPAPSRPGRTREPGHEGDSAEHGPEGRTAIATGEGHRDADGNTLVSWS